MILKRGKFNIKPFFFWGWLSNDCLAGESPRFCCAVVALGGSIDARGAWLGVAFFKNLPPSRPIFMLSDLELWESDNWRQW
jgi:hypothetical protein